jgi:ubiquinone/menaquinone biosynthesis C-methylase UbiE
VVRHAGRGSGKFYTSIFKNSRIIGGARFTEAGPGGEEEVMSEVQRSYLPAAGHDWFLPFYDPFVKLLGGDRARRVLVDQAALRPGHRVLDVGCGTGALVMEIKRLYPEVDVVGLDPDPKALARARRKAKRAAVSIRFDQGFADELPYPDASFDRVFSSFMFHHLEPDEREKTLQEIRRTLRPGGFLHLLDFGGPKAGSDGFLARWLHSSHRLRDNDEGRILTLMEQGGFRDAREVGRGAMFFAQITYYKASVHAS